MLIASRTATPTAQITVEGGGGGGGGVTTVPAKMLQKIRRSKYPAVTAEEEAISIPLQTLCQVRGVRPYV